ncbi:MAG: hypothetical protein Q9171_006914 [Xanthocarpia ochracea]
MTTAFSSALKRGRTFLTPTNSSISIPTLENGFVKAPEATGKTDCLKDVSDEKGSVMEAVRDCGVEPANGANDKIEKLMLSASNMPTPQDHYSPSDPTPILLLPSFTIVENVTPKTVPTLIEHSINPAPMLTTPLAATTATSREASKTLEHSISALILQRDEPPPHQPHHRSPPAPVPTNISSSSAPNAPATPAAANPHINNALGPASLEGCEPLTIGFDWLQDAILTQPVKPMPGT